LRPPCPAAHPFLRDERDTGGLEAGLGMIRQATACLAFFSRVRAAEAHPGPGITTSAGLRAWIRTGTVGSYWHPVGTCHMGLDTDPGAVVDPQLRVRGITGLRVAEPR
jgi:choline dehydrogenase-like flavoprotein